MTSEEKKLAKGPDFRTLQVILLGLLMGLLPLFPPGISPNAKFFCGSLLIFTFILNWVYCRENFTQAKKNLPLYLPWLLILIISAVSIFYSPSIEPGIEKLIILAYGLIAALLAMSLSLKQQKIIGIIMGISGFLVATLMIYRHANMVIPTPEEFKELFGHLTPRMQDDIWDSIRERRALGPFGNPNHAACYLMIPILWWAGLIRWGKISMPVKILGLTLMAIIFWAFFLTLSRTGLVILFVAFLGWIFYEIHRVKPKLAYGAVFGLFFLVSVAIYFLITQMGEGDQFGGRLLVSVTIKARIEYWRGAILSCMNNPYFGTGLNSFSIVYPFYKLPGGIESKFVHNYILEAIQELGIPGLLLWSWWSLLLIKGIWIKIRNRFEDFNSGITLIALLVSGIFLLAWQVDFINNVPTLMILFGFHVGILFGSAKTKNDETFLAKMDWKSGTAILFGLLIWFGFYYNSLQSELAFQNGLEYLKKGQAENALPWYEKSKNSVPWSGLYHQHYGETLFRMGNVQEGIQEVQLAESLSPQAFMAERLSRLYWETGNTQKALESIQRAISRHPVNPEYHLVYASYLEQFKENQKAQKERDLAHALDIEYGKAKLHW